MGTQIKSIQEEIDRIQKELEKTIDQFVVLSIDSNGNVTKMYNNWNVNGTGEFTNPEEFKTPVNQGKKITWIGIPYEGTHTIIIENIAIKPGSKDVLKQKAYKRKGGNYFVVGKIKDNGVNRVSEGYSITFSVHGSSTKNIPSWYTIDPVISVHDE